MHRAAVGLKKKIFHTFVSRDKFSFIIEYTSDAENSSYTRVFTQTHTRLDNRLSACYDQQGISLEHTAFRRKTFNTRWDRERSANANERTRAGFGFRIAIAAKTQWRVSLAVYVREARITAECVFICILSRRCIRVRPTNEWYARVCT